MYDLHILGWNAFQQLCLTVTREILGQTVEAFLDSNDGGRDGAFAGKWSLKGEEAFTGPFVIQCKFTSRRDHTLSVADLAEEVVKTKKLVERGLCETYVLMTNAGLSGTVAAEISETFKSVGVQHVGVLGSTWVSQQISENKRLRMLVPRVYGLGDLSQILDERAYTQARAILESMHEDLSKVVVTDAYRRSVDAINTHGFVLLVGEPAAGKSTIASLLAMAALDQWGASTLKVDNPTLLAERWNPDEPSQFFWVDDAFGVMQYEDSLVRAWNHLLPQVKTMIAKGAKIVMTSRDYIYNRARRDLKESAFPLLKESQVVIDVHELSNQEKRQILYNHLRLGRQPKLFRTEIKPHLEQVALHPRFIPETARRLADPLFTRGLFIDDYYISRFIEKREEFLHEVIQGLDADSKAALALIYMRNGRLASPTQLVAAEAEAIGRLQSDLGRCLRALEALEGSLVILMLAGDESFWQFKHPTIGDAYAATLVLSPEHLGIFIQGSAPDGLIHQVVCGDVGIEKSVIVPKPLFPQMLAKIETLTSSKAYKSATLSTFQARSDLQGFLARRCSKDFLALYLERHPALLELVSNPGLFLDTVPEVRLAQRLYELGLLPEVNRLQFVEKVQEYALGGEDGDALDDPGIVSLFTTDERETFLLRVRAELLPRIADVRNDWETQFSDDGRPEDHMQQLIEFFDSLKNVFANEDRIVGEIERQIRYANDWISENSAEDRGSASRKLEKIEVNDKPNGMRSIFDDVDADG